MRYKAKMDKILQQKELLQTEAAIANSSAEFVQEILEHGQPYEVYTLTHSLTHSRTHALAHHSRTHSLTYLDCYDAQTNATKIGCSESPKLGRTASKRENAISE